MGDAHIVGETKHDMHALFLKSIFFYKYIYLGQKKDIGKNMQAITLNVSVTHVNYFHVNSPPQAIRTIQCSRLYSFDIVIFELIVT